MSSPFALVPENQMSAAAKKVRDFYEIKPGAAIYEKEFYFYEHMLDQWAEQGHIRARRPGEDYDDYTAEVFGLDEPAVFNITGLGWCEAGFCPAFEEKILEDRGDYELVQDYAGRSLLCFKNRRMGFMPEYVDHPVKDMYTWEKNVKWRMDPNTPGRDALSRAELERAKEGAKKGGAVVQRCIGGYMYLRSLMGPEELLYMFYDDPDLIHDCMKTWLELADAVTARHQQEIAFDELYLGEDICYNHGALISPDMMKEFLLPYYQQLYTNVKRRNPDQNRKLHFQIDTDGYCGDVIPIYQSIGVDFMSPFEVASNCDVVELGRRFPELRLSGGIDKRIIAEGGDALKRHLDYIMPAMRDRGGFIPSCDHIVPENVSFEQYMEYRALMHEYCK